MFAIFIIYQESLLNAFAIFPWGLTAACTLQSLWDLSYDLMHIQQLDYLHFYTIIFLYSDSHFLFLHPGLTLQDKNPITPDIPV